ncbi:hypothetical protein EDB19DRAFT_1916043 [Suillus lakei]|nr:hypothetical protein EDB19DRAFT_1916043 [Suillus lakei]
MTKSIHMMMGNKAKGTRVHSAAEIFSKKGFATNVRDQMEEAIASGSVVTKAERLNTMKRLTREAYEAAHPEVKALCLAKVEEERETKASELLKPGTRERTNAELAKALEECTAPIAHFLQAIHEMTGFHWTILGAGPDPRCNGDINVMSYHTGINEYGQNWQQATPNFDDKHIKPFVAFVSSLFPEHIRKTHALDHVLPTPSSTLGTEANPVAGESQSSDASHNLPSTSALTRSPHLLPHVPHVPIPADGNVHQPPADVWYPAQHPQGLISFDHGYDLGGSVDFGMSDFHNPSEASAMITSGQFGMSDFHNPSEISVMSASMPSSSLSACLDSPSISPISTWTQRDVHYTSPPRLRPRLFAANFASSTPTSGIISRPSPAPFIAPLTFNFPSLPAPLRTPGSSMPAPTVSLPTSGSSTPAPTVSLPTSGSSTPAPTVSLPTPGSSTPPPTVSATISVEVSHGGAAVSGQSLSNHANIAENDTANASVEGIDTSGVGTPGATAVEAVRVDSDKDVTFSKPKGHPTCGKHIRQVPTVSEIPNDSNSTQPVRKTGRIRTETTRLMQANNIGQNLKRSRSTKPQSERPKKK